MHTYPIAYLCCKKKLETNRHFFKSLGRRVKCPECGHKFPIKTENVVAEENNSEVIRSLQKTIEELTKQLEEKSNNQEIDDETRRQIEDQTRKEEQNKFLLEKLQYQKLMEQNNR